jgi:hypothetical protein
MPAVERFNRCRIEMYFKDHAPPHFHIVTTSNERISVVIESLEVLAGMAGSRDVTEALTWAKTNRDALRRLWRQYSE